MVDLIVISPESHAKSHAIKRLPVIVGRSGSNISFDVAGVSERHFSINISSEGNIYLSTIGPSIVLVNGQAFESGALKNGDLISFGNIKACFRIGQTVGLNLGALELATWVLLSLIVACEVILWRWC